MAASDRTPVEYLWATMAVGAATAVGVLLRDELGVIDFAMIYLLAVVIVASRCRGGPALLAATLAVAAFDFFFVPPYHTFNVRDSRFYLTFLVMLAVALAMSRLTARIRRQAEDASAREQVTAARYALTQEAGRAGGRSQLLEVIASHFRRAAGSPVTLVPLPAPAARAGAAPDLPPQPELEDFETRLAATAALRTGRPAGLGSGEYAEADVLVLPLRAAARVVALAVVRPERPDRPLPGLARRILEALAEEAALALERADVAERHEAARMELETERLRTALLSSLSHDLRTPLSTIEGAASSLARQDADLPAEGRRELAESILEESRRMHRMVGNLLDMVRVESGMLAVHKAWQPLEEPLGVALIRLDRRLAEHPVAASLPPDLPLVPIDELLIEQVFINLLENAARHTPPGTPIAVAARAHDGVVEVEVSDRGPGIPPGQEEAVFRRFHRARPTEDAGGGAGLGLTICRGIVTAHGGRIWIDPGRRDGTTVRFALPLAGLPPPAAIEAAGGGGPE